MCDAILIADVLNTFTLTLHVRYNSVHLGSTGLFFVVVIDGVGLYFPF